MFLEMALHKGIEAGAQFTQLLFAESLLHAVAVLLHKGLIYILVNKGQQGLVYGEQCANLPVVYALVPVPLFRRQLLVVVS